MQKQSAQIYWQVADIDTPGFPRVYPESYQPHVVGMLWSTLAQMQTWFGAEAWKVYGIQVIRMSLRFSLYVRTVVELLPLQVMKADVRQLYPLSHCTASLVMKFCFLWVSPSSNSTSPDKHTLAINFGILGCLVLS